MQVFGEKTEGIRILAVEGRHNKIMFRRCDGEALNGLMSFGIGQVLVPYEGICKLWGSIIRRKFYDKLRNG
jgi:hypothetical protein